MPMTIVELLAGIVRGDEMSAAALSEFDADIICEHAEFQGVLPLVARQLRGSAQTADRLRNLLRQRAAQAAVADLLAEAELKRLVAALDAAGAGALLIKGSQLAYSHYARPDLRPRLDTDILISADSRTTVHDVLARLGYVASNNVTGELVIGQSFHIVWRDGIAVHSVDVHWKVANPLVFAQVFSYEELAARSLPVPALGPAARAPSAVDALLIACVHRVAHHLDLVRLNWLYDIDLIARRLGGDEWNDFVERAVQRKVAAVCRRSLERAVFWFHTPVPNNVSSRLERAGAASNEVTAAYLTKRSQAGALVDDLRALENWRDRWRLVREHVFPPADYMRLVYAPSSAAPLPALYMWRVIRGARKWLTH